MQERLLLDALDVEDMLAWDHAGGFSLDASVRIEDWDRQALERLLRYCARPPFAASRIGRLEDGSVAYDLPRPAPDGRTCLFLDPLELLSRLAALIPPPRMNLVRYFGVLAPNSTSMRQQVIQTAGPSPALFESLAGAARCMGLETVQEVDERIEATADDRCSPAEKEADKEALPEQEDSAVNMRQDDQSGQPEAPRRRASYLWAMLIARIYEALPLLCPQWRSDYVCAW